jgi:hypothetical protein
VGLPLPNTQLVRVAASGQAVQAAQVLCKSSRSIVSSKSKGVALIIANFVAPCNTYPVIGKEKTKKVLPNKKGYCIINSGKTK